MARAADKMSSRTSAMIEAIERLAHLAAGAPGVREV